VVLASAVPQASLQEAELQGQAAWPPWFQPVAAPLGARAVLAAARQQPAVAW